MDQPTGETVVRLCMSTAGQLFTMTMPREEYLQWQQEMIVAGKRLPIAYTRQQVPDLRSIQDARKFFKLPDPVTG